MSEIFLLKLQKIIGQIRFRPTVLSFNGVPPIASIFEKDFEEWRATQRDEITLFSVEKKQYLQITASSVTLLEENKTTKENYKKNLKRYIGTTIKEHTETNAIEETRRIGLRVVQLYTTPFDFTDLVDLIYRKFYSNSSQIKEIAFDTIIDNAFILDASKNGFNNHIRIGAVKKTEIAPRFNSSFDLNLESIEDNNILIDVDVFIDNETIIAGDVFMKLEEAVEENFRIIESFKDYLSDRK